MSKSGHWRILRKSGLRFSFWFGLGTSCAQNNLRPLFNTNISRLMKKMVSETNFGHSELVHVRKSVFPHNTLMAWFLNFGFLTCIQKSEVPPWITLFFSFAVKFHVHFKWAWFLFRSIKLLRPFYLCQCFDVTPIQLTPFPSKYRTSK